MTSAVGAEMQANAGGTRANLRPRQRAEASVPDTYVCDCDCDVIPPTAQGFVSMLADCRLAVGGCHGLIEDCIPSWGYDFLSGLRIGATDQVVVDCLCMG